MSGTVEVTEKSDAAKIIAASSLRVKVVTLGIALLLLGAAGFVGHTVSSRSHPEAVEAHAPVSARPVAAAAPTPASGAPTPVAPSQLVAAIAAKRLEGSETSPPVAAPRVVVQPVRAHPRSPAPSKPRSGVEPARQSAVSTLVEPSESSLVSADIASASESKNASKARAVLVPSRAKFVD